MVDTIYLYMMKYEIVTCFVTARAVAVGEAAELASSTNRINPTYDS